MGRGGPAAAAAACTAIIESGAELTDSLPYAYLYRAEAQVALRQGEAAFQDFTRAATLAPDLAHAHFGLGELYKEKSDWAHAAEEFGKAARSQAEDADIDHFTAESEGSFRAKSLTEEGHALLKNGEVDKALAELDEAIKLCPTCSSSWREKATALDAASQHGAALAAADKAIAQDIRSPAAFLVRGVLRAHVGNYDGAVDDFSEAIRLLPTFEVAYKARARAYGRLGKSKEAAADEKTAADLAAGAVPVSGSPADPVATKLRAVPALDAAALSKLFSAKSWEARQGPWLATLEFRGDGTFRQHASDMSAGSRLQITVDGAWGISRGELCIYTSSTLCLAGRELDGDIVLTRAEIVGSHDAQGRAGAGVVEFSGTVGALKDLSADAVSDPVAELQVEEVFLPAPTAPPKGPKTLFYYMHGFAGRARAHAPIPQYFVSEMQNSRGWDVIDGNYPRSGVTAIRRFGASNWGAAEFLARRLRELKAQGYQRIYVGGQSWGGWTALLLATMRGLPLDGVVLVVPACCGWSFTGANPDDVNFANNKVYFDQMIARVRYPTVAVFFAGDEYEPADRSKSAASALLRNRIPNVIIDHPPGFAGHGAAWFPVFDYEYGSCIANFLEKPVAFGYCPQRLISRDTQDFSAILRADQIPTDRASHIAKLADLLGRRFAVYPVGDLRKIVSADKTEVSGYGIGDSVLDSSFDSGDYCIRGRVKFNQPETTDKICVALVEWSGQEVLGVDRRTGDVVQWWVEHP